MLFVMVSLQLLSYCMLSLHQSLLNAIAIRNHYRPQGLAESVRERLSPTRLISARTPEILKIGPKRSQQPCSFASSCTARPLYTTKEMTDGLIHVVPLTPLETLTPPLDPGPKAHHTPTGFTNPWKSYNKEARQLGPTDLLKVKFFGPRAEPVPERMEDRPVQVVKDLDFSPRADGSKDGVKMIWIGHASWLVGTSDAIRYADGSFREGHLTVSKRICIEFPSSEAGKRGMTVLLDPVFSDRMSPVSFAVRTTFRLQHADLTNLCVSWLTGI